MGGDWYLRRYVPADAPKLRTFTCTTPNAKWTKVPQRMIRQVPEDIEDRELDVSVLVAAQTSYNWIKLRPQETGFILGVIVYEIENGQFVSHALGVVRDRRREGIGWALKRAALANALAEGAERDVVSHVHKRNTEMNGLNAKLGGASAKDVEDGELLLTVVTAIPPANRPPWHGAADLLGRFSRAALPGPWREPIP